MSRLLDLVDDYKDRHGQPSDASIARAVGVAPQTISSWRKRGIRDLPAPETLDRLARFIGVDKTEVVLAANVDAGFLTAADADRILAREPAEEVGDDDRSAAM